MIIRNGFVRDEHGDWSPLSLYSGFSTSILYEEMGQSSYRIVGALHKTTDLNSEEHEEDYEPVVIEDGFDSLDTAQCALDDAFGYTE